MKNLHIAFVMIPHDPYINPTLPVVSVLVRRGYRVSYVTSNRFAHRIAELGAEVVACSGIDTSKRVVETVDQQQNLENIVRDHARQRLSEVTPFYNANKPDLIVYTYVDCVGRVLANAWKIPAVQASVTFAFDKENFSQQVRHEEFRDLTLFRGAYIDRSLQQLGTDSVDCLFHREGLNICWFPKAFQPDGDVFGEDFFYAGRCPAEQPYYGDWRKTNNGGRPIVLISTSTSYVRGEDYFRMCIEAFSSLNWHVILSIGGSGCAAALRPLPSHFEIVQNTSHIQILRHAHLMICVGGIITTAEAAYHGVPLIIPTCGVPELEWLADHTTSLGLGIHLRKADTNVDSLKHAIARISEDFEIQDKVKKMQRIVRREPGGEETANRIVDYLEGVN